MSSGRDGRYSKALQWVGMGMWVGWAMGGKVAGIAGVLLGGAGAMVAAFRIRQEL